MELRVAHHGEIKKRIAVMEVVHVVINDGEEEEIGQTHFGGSWEAYLTNLLSLHR